MYFRKFSKDLTHFVIMPFMWLFFLFSLVFLTLFTLANLYIYKRLFMQIPFLRAHKIWLIIAFVALFIAQAAFLMFRADDKFGSLLYNALAHCFAFTYFFFFITLFADILRLIVKIYMKKANNAPFDENRRASIKLIFNLSLLFFALSSVWRGWGNAMNVPKVKEFSLSLKNLSQNTRLVMISDVHLGKNLHEKFLRGLVERINSLNADIVVIVGDLIDTKPQDIDYIHILDEIQSKFGVYFALGNHEYYRGLDGVLTLLKQTKLKILINESINLGFLNIGGLADLSALRFDKFGVKPDIDATKAGLDKSVPSILLAHQPKSVSLYDTSDFDLVLSGHTHAGQVFPFGALVLAQQGFLYGLYELESKNKLYVSSGAGFWGPAMRFLAPSEIALIHLKGE